MLIPRLSDEQVSEVLLDIEPQIRNDIFQAYLNNNKLDPNLQQLLETDLIELIEATKSEEGNVKEIEKAANLINQFPSETSDNLIEFLERSSPELAVTIKKSLFKFASIAMLSTEDRSAYCSTASIQKKSLEHFQQATNQYVNWYLRCSLKETAEW